MKGLAFRLSLLALAAFVTASARGATIVVNSADDTAADDGQCTLREAITAANGDTASGRSPGECAAGDHPSSGTSRDEIRFDIPGGGPFVIKPQTPLPHVTQPVLIDGYSQPGARPNSRRDGSDALLLIELRGEAMQHDCEAGSPSPIDSAALQFAGREASGSRLRGLAVAGFDGPHMAHVVVFRAGGVQIDGNFIGLDAQGGPVLTSNVGVALLNGAGELVSVEKRTPFDDDAPGNLVGGRTPQERNVIAANGVGIAIGGQGNQVVGNYVGVDPSGEESLPNLAQGLMAGTIRVSSCQVAHEDFVFSGDRNTVGGLASGSGNFFSAEAGDCAVQVFSDENRVQGNCVGTDRSCGPGRDGLGLGAQPGCGIRLEGRASGNLVESNTVAYASKGIVVVSGQSNPAGNDLRANSLHDNLALGIDLANDGPTANDPQDADSGPNGLQNFPDGLAATTSGVRGRLQGLPNTEHRVDFYRSRRCHASGFGEGERFLGSTSVLTDAGGKASFSVSLGGLALEEVVTATATTREQGTSELSRCATVQSGAGAVVEVTSSLNPARTGQAFDLTVLVTGSAGVRPTGSVVLLDLRRPYAGPNGQTTYPTMAYGSLVPSSSQPDRAELLVPSSALVLGGSSWGNARIRAEYRGDAVYARTASPEFVQTLYRPSSDLDGNGLSDLLLCDAAGEKYVLQDQGGVFVGPTRLPALGAGRTVLGLGEFGLPAEPAVLWSDASGRLGGTPLTGGAAGADFSVPLPAGLTVEGLGSMYGDLKDDLVARDASGQHAGVLTGFLGGGQLKLLTPWPVGAANAHLVEHVADFDGDGNADWLFRHPVSGRQVMWRLDGTFRVLAGGDPGAVPMGGRAVATADFDGDGRADIVWALPSGDLEIVMQDGLTSLGSLVVPLSATGLRFVTTGLFDDGTGSSHGRASLVLRDGTTGQLEARINTGATGGLPVFGKTVALPTGGLILGACR
ncbi:MAG: CSLREA domain-containing protein [Chitinophagaceae bacterium]|nr:CSLREA domain-containing protein [Chitinophagaceae bacterium]